MPIFKLKIIVKKHLLIKFNFLIKLKYYINLSLFKSISVYNYYTPISKILLYIYINILTYYKLSVFK